MSDLLPFLVAVPLLGALAPLVVGVGRPDAVGRVTAAVLLVHLGVAAAAVWGGRHGRLSLVRRRRTAGRVRHRPPPRRGFERVRPPRRRRVRGRPPRGPNRPDGTD
ncbi:hypothetical protein [Halogeometricum sp. CBA1124]|uniref:hypothetical protein n=1 Tax=Halogeometricum sp. CBA1124 TaxID=2668071 RepID=UPI001E3E7917|nr:hypothetical protein [Halogeometricum sp. CBA1124]